MHCARTILLLFSIVIICFLLITLCAGAPFKIQNETFNVCDRILRKPKNKNNSPPADYLGEEVFCNYSTRITSKDHISVGW